MDVIALHNTILNHALRATDAGVECTVESICIMFLVLSFIQIYFWMNAWWIWDDKLCHTHTEEFCVTVKEIPFLRNTHTPTVLLCVGMTFLMFECIFLKAKYIFNTAVWRPNPLTCALNNAGFVTLYMTTSWNCAAFSHTPSWQRKAWIH